MGTASFVITDLDTSTSVTLQQQDTPSEYDSPPPSTDVTTHKRAVVVHEIPMLDFDVAQDMAASAMKRSISGICLLAIRNTLITWIDTQPNFTGSNPAGRYSILSKDRFGNTTSTISHAALEQLAEGPLAGSPKWYKITLNIIKVSPSQ